MKYVYAKFLSDELVSAAKVRQNPCSGNRLFMACCIPCLWHSLALYIINYYKIGCKGTTFPSNFRNFTAKLQVIIHKDNYLKK